MKRFYYCAAMLMIAASLTTLSSCDDDDEITIAAEEEETTTTIVTTTEGAYVINTGDWYANNGSIMWYDPSAMSISDDLFETANGSGIGDAQDMTVYGTRAYIACSTSAKIEIVDRESFVVEQTLNLANDEGQSIQPRYLVADGGYVYYTAYDGTVNRIDTLSLSVTASVDLGSYTYPEALSAANGKLYINISGYGSGSTIAVVDIDSFTLTDELDVVLDPYDVNFLADDGYVYFTSMGGYGYTTRATLQRINPETDEVSTVCYAAKAAYYDDKIYYISADYYSSDPGEIGVYDLSSGSSSTFVDYDSFIYPQFIAVDPISGDVYIGDYSYGVKNDLYIYSNDGELIDQQEVGFYTTNVRFITAETEVTE